MSRLDAVQLKVPLAGRDAERIAGALGLVDAGHGWNVHFCEEPGRSLYERGIILRFRQADDGSRESTVKLRPCRRSRLTPRWLRLRRAGDHRFRLEEDWAGDRVLVAALDATPPAGRLFTDLHHDFLADCAGPVDLEHLAVLGPVRVRRCAPVRWHGYDLAARWWGIPGGPDTLEVSVRVDPRGAEVVWQAIDALLRDLGVQRREGGRTTALILDRLRGHG
jgi:hypothetical protein